jgi:hypothetical protein
MGCMVLIYNMFQSQPFITLAGTIAKKRRNCGRFVYGMPLFGLAALRAQSNGRGNWVADGC